MFLIVFGLNYLFCTIEGLKINTILLFDTQAGGSQTRCLNLHCPGFVLANPIMPVDPILSPISKQGGPTYGIQISIKKVINYLVINI